MAFSKSIFKTANINYLNGNPARFRYFILKIFKTLHLFIYFIFFLIVPERTKNETPALKSLIYTGSQLGLIHFSFTSKLK